jgi:hypothetical protein
MPPEYLSHLDVRSRRSRTKNDYGYLIIPFFWILAAKPCPPEWLYDEHSRRLALIGLTIGQWDRLSEGGYGKEYLENLFWGGEGEANNPEERILAHLGALIATAIPFEKFPRFRELTQDTIIGQHLFEKVKGKGQTEEEIYHISVGRNKKITRLLFYVLEIEAGEQRERFNSMYEEFFVFQDDLYDFWDDRDRGFVTWINQQGDPVCAVVEKWNELAKMGRTIDDGPGEMFLLGHALMLKIAIVKYRWSTLLRRFFKKSA